ncbi:MAG: bifunctional metallophosphatase/5'-nucleotidase, partial [Clostridia bacterium]
MHVNPRHCPIPRLLLGAMVLAVMVLVFSVQPPEASASGFRFTVFHTNDEHSALWPRPALDYVPGGRDSTVGGFARLGAVLQRERAARGDRPTLTVSAGDSFTGSPFAWLSLRESAVEYELLARMGYDVAIPGNHAWDFGPDFFADYLAEAGYPRSNGPALVDSSAEIPSGHPLEDSGLVRTHVVEIGGEYGWDRPIKVGFFGILGDEAAAVAPEANPVSFAEPIGRAREMVKILEDEGADVIIAITHAGVEEDREIAREVAGIDLIIGGHSHDALFAPVTEEDVTIVQAGSRAEYLGCLDLRYDEADDRLHVENPAMEKPFLIPIRGDVREDPDIAEIVADCGERLDAMLADLTDDEYREMLRPVAAMDGPIP